MNRFSTLSLPVTILLVLVAVAAVACLSGPGRVGAVVGSPWFFVPAGLLAVAAPVKVAVHGRLRTWRNRVLFLAHLGMTLAMVGVLLNRRQGGPGHMYVETGTIPKAAFLESSLRRVDVLEQGIRLDSVRMRSVRGFRSGPVAWVRSDDAGGEPGSGQQFALRWNRPWSVSGRQVMLSGMVDPGFPHEYELKVGDDEYILMHNQRLELPDGRKLWCDGYDREEKRLRLRVGDSRQWLEVGDSIDLDGIALELGPVHFSRREGVLLLVKETGMRPVLFAGLGLMLLGFVPVLVGRRWY
ncbi:MAG: hypothetical protein JSU73_06075 [candidate division WOR-3 bacterium]|nr:MAG: hypothetical protein JSU73_06075 [candidate division WOR-3 bacterium]